MLGWWIVVERLGKNGTMMSWQASIGGLGWIEKVVQDGKAIQSRKDGYPNRYEGRARDILPLIWNGPPAHVAPLVIGDNYVSRGGWIRDFKRDDGLVRACPLDAALIIEAWDQS